MIRSTEKQSTETGKRILAMIVLLIILTAFLPGHSSLLFMNAAGIQKKECRH